jgi:hypothetical protein
VADLFLVRRMRAYDLACFLWLSTLAICSGGEPDRAKGLSVHMLPDRVAQIDGHSGGFTVGDSQTTYARPAELVAYFHTLPATTQENGLWVVTTHPSAYSAAERETLGALIALCQQQKIPISTCRGSELPTGWKRGEVPAGWNTSSEAP